MASPNVLIALLSQRISMYTSNDHTNWHSIVPFITFACNTPVQSTTGFSPFFLVYGLNVSSTIDTLFPGGGGGGGAPAPRA
ncbi:MAG: hypothetical protein PV344_01510, partial [Anaplasma sp.]|nr:hypothetical protein [Anaplasma sp.]